MSFLQVGLTRIVRVQVEFGKTLHKDMWFAIE